jgi:hypothetical protein
MTSPASIERTRSAFALLATPVTLAPKAIGELDGVGADASRGADDQHLLPGCDAPGAQALQGGQPGQRDDGGLPEAQPGGNAVSHWVARSR